MKEKLRKRRKSDDDEDHENLVVAEKVRKIVSREFDESIDEKTREIRTIDDRILEVRKALHVVRKGSVASYYSGSVPKQSAEDVSIHPAIRGLIGGKRPTSARKAANATLALAKKEQKKVTVPKLLSTASSQSSSSTSPGSSSVTTRASQHKAKRRIIVGNVSKWIACDQRSEDQATHKWMIYVRGPENDDDLSDVVEKVRFLIHPSYHPHDVIEVNKAPFRLTRRGWGEFPARVQIHFKTAKSNKPVDVIHHLKLDRTYTGYQTLGSETVVDVWLQKAKNRCDKSKLTTTKSSPSSIIEDTPVEGLVIPHSTNDILSEEFIMNSISSPNQDPTLNPEGKLSNVNRANKIETTSIREDFQHQNHRQQNHKKPPLRMRTRNSGVHNQLTPSSSVKISLLKPIKPGTSLLKINNYQQQQQLLIVEDSESEYETELEKATPNIPLTLWSKILGRANSESQADIEQRLSSDGVKRQVEYLVYLSDKVFSLRACDFKNGENCLLYAAKYFPLVTPLAKDPLYRALHPYSAPSEKAFRSWNVGKQMAAEHDRALMIRRIFTSIDSLSKASMPVRRIVQLLKSHGHSVVPSTRRVNNKRNNTGIASSTEVKCKTVINVKNVEKVLNELKSADFADLIDVMSEDEDDDDDHNGVGGSPANKTSVSRLSMAEDDPDAFRFVDQEARKIGIKISPHEEIVPGIFYPSAFKVMIQACKSLAESMLRKSHAELWRNKIPNKEVGIDEVKVAIKCSDDFRDLFSDIKCQEEEENEEILLPEM